ncbi:la-related protein 6A-like [Coffea eugenioides]|uniref:la-related protein 6A-like n=1 Tax=Coffea eugenioides TaxID=49369 RepID=UPI000F611B2D|nr:la-related protein 6A-like [Coffea eugenioides]
MEAEGVPIPSMSASHPPTSDDHPDFSPAGSPDLADEQHQQLLMPSDQPAVTLSDDLRDKIIKQVEYYFSDENLPADKFLMKYVSKDKDGYGALAGYLQIHNLFFLLSVIWQVACIA